MRQTILTAAVVGLGLSASGSVLADDATDDPMDSNIRKTAISIGNAWACETEDKRAQFGEEAHHLFDLILQRAGSNLAFVYSASQGNGLGQPKDTLECPALLKQWEGSRAEGGARMNNAT